LTTSYVSNNSDNRDTSSDNAAPLANSVKHLIKSKKRKTVVVYLGYLAAHSFL